VHDSVQFVGQSLPVLGAVLDGYRDVAQLAAAGQPAAERAKVALKGEADADVAFVLEELPGAVARTQHGLDRISGIVRAMRAYSSGQANEPATSVDLNDCVRATLTLSQSEYRDVATVETDLAELPPVKGFSGELNLALLTIVVNAAHAVAETARTTGATGRISVKTRREGLEAVVSISDNGPGIPVTIRHRIFDPFFTTKGPGHGTGHGLAMARKIVVERHGGKLTFQSTEGQGTTFEVRLPLAARVTPPTTAARAA
jgi:two-component system, NtrC family, sensor kinase